MDSPSPSITVSTLPPIISQEVVTAITLSDMAGSVIVHDDFRDPSNNIGMPEQQEVA
jgi:hypothetical protein